MAEFFEMGGYGYFIWPAWAAGFIAIGGITFIIRRRLDAAIRTLKKMEKKGRRNG